MVVGLLTENSGLCLSIFKVLGSVQTGMKRRQLDLRLVGRREALEVAIIQMVSEVMGQPRWRRQNVMEKMGA